MELRSEGLGSVFLNAMNKRTSNAHLALLGAGTLWGLMSPVGKVVMGAGVGGLALASMRMVGAAALFWLASAFVPKQKVARRDLVLLFFAGLLGIACNQGLFIVGLSYTSPVDATLITTSMPIITMVLAALFLREPITSVKASGVAIGAVGAVLLIWNSRSGTAASGNLLGNLMCLTAQFSFACYLTLFKKLIGRYHVVTLMKWMFVFAAAVVLPFSFSDLSATLSHSFSVEVWLGIGFVVVFCTFVCYLLALTGQKALRPTVVSMYNYVQPIVGSVAAVWLGVGRFGWTEALAAALIAAGVYVVTQSKSRAQVEAERKK